MLTSWIYERARRRKAANGLYNSAAAQSRDSAFFTRMGVPDTFDGRFDLLCLHAALLIIRLKHEGTKPARKLTQAVFDRMFRATDETLREMGVGDLSVPRHMKKMMAAFNGRIHAYDAALSHDDPRMLREAVMHNIYRQEEEGDLVGLEDMVSYIKAIYSDLQATGYETLNAGNAAFAGLKPIEKEVRHA